MLIARILQVFVIGVPQVHSWFQLLVSMAGHFKEVDSLEQANIGVLPG